MLGVIEMIEQLLLSYHEKLCAQEIMLVTNFFNSTSDIKAAELLADRLSAKGYGLALNRASPVDIEAVNGEIMKYDIADITQTSVEYINSLPYDVQDELIYFYSINRNMKQEDLENKLNGIMNLKPDTANSEVQTAVVNKKEPNKQLSSVNKKAVHTPKSQKPSLLGRLRKYERMIQEGLRQ